MRYPVLTKRKSLTYVSVLTAAMLAAIAALPLLASSLVVAVGMFLMGGHVGFVVGWSDRSEHDQKD